MTLEYLTAFKLCSDPEAVYLQEEAERNKENTEEKEDEKDPDSETDNTDPGEVINDPSADPAPDGTEKEGDTDITENE